MIGFCESQYQLRGDDVIRCVLPQGHPGEHQAFLTWVNEDEEDLGDPRDP